MQEFPFCFFSQNVPKKAPASRRFCLQGPEALTGKFHIPASELFPGALAQVCTDIFDLCGVFRHRLFRGLEHIITVVGHGLADSAGLGLGGGDDLRRTLLGGAVVNETVFSLPGLGTLMINAINQKNEPVVLGCLITFAIIFSLVNLLIDILYAFIDPRIKSQYK